MLNRYTHCPAWMLIVGPGLALLVSILILIILASGFLPAGVILFLPFIPYFILACIRLRRLLRGYVIIESAQADVQGTEHQVVDDEQLADPS